MENYLEINKCNFCEKHTKMLYNLTEFDNKKICGYCITKNLRNLWVMHETEKTREISQGVMV